MFTVLKMEQIHSEIQSACYFQNNIWLKLAYDLSHYIQDSCLSSERQFIDLKMEFYTTLKLIIDMYYTVRC